MVARLLKVRDCRDHAFKSVIFRKIMIACGLHYNCTASVAGGELEFALSTRSGRATTVATLTDLTTTQLLKCL